MTSYAVAVVGGTGPQGKGLGYRFARHGHRVVLGSRTAEKAALVAAEVADRKGVTGEVSGAANADAVAGAEVVVLAIPYAGHDELVASLADQLAGKIVISCVNPLGFDKRGPYGLDVERSAAESAAALVPTARVVGGFHHVSAVSLWSDDEYLDHEDVLVCGDDPDANAVVMELAATVTGRPGVDAGALRLARQLEPLTAVLISINKRYKTRSGVRISGL
jgi:NADPH-dependent F420 reductase